MSSDVRTLIGVVAGLASITFAILTIYLESNLRYMVKRLFPQERRKGGGTPTERSRTIWASFVLSGLIGIVGAAIVNFAPTNPAFDETLDSVEIEGSGNNVLVAYNQRGFPIWRKSFDTRISVVLPGDIDDDGTQEVFVGFELPGTTPGLMIAFDELGNKLGELNVWKPSIYPGAAKEDARVVDFKIVDLTSDGKKELVVISNDIYWYASKLSVIEFSQGNFNIISEYWNPGLLYTLDITDLENDGTKEIVVTGVNNDLQGEFPLGGNVRVVFMLEGDHISGQAPPWYGNGERGSEVWYGYITPREEIYVTGIMFEDVNNDGLTDTHLPLSDACSFYVDKIGQIIGYGRGSACREESEFTIWP